MACDFPEARNWIYYKNVIEKFAKKFNKVKTVVYIPKVIEKIKDPRIPITKTDFFFWVLLIESYFIF